MFWKRKARWICCGSLVGVTLYVLFCWFEHHQAINLTEAFAKSLNEEVIQVASLPQPISPFRWADYVETRDKVYQGFVDLLREERPQSIPNPSSFFEKLSGLYDPPGKIRYRSWEKNQNSPWVKRALTTERVKFYYWFARFPVVKSVNSGDGIHRVEFMDIRFLLPGIRTPFIYYVEMDDFGRIQSEGFVGDRKGN